MKVKEHYWETMMEQERQQQEMEEHMYALTREALIEAAKHLKQEQIDVLMYHCGFTDNDLQGATK
jgi:superfamily II DNA helicase RecQ